jgi:hypothetical protein
MEDAVVDGAEGGVVADRVGAAVLSRVVATVVSVDEASRSCKNGTATPEEDSRDEAESLEINSGEATPHAGGTVLVGSSRALGP